jgi:hypothetical protein
MVQSCHQRAADERGLAGRVRAAAYEGHCSVACRMGVWPTSCRDCYRGCSLVGRSGLSAEVAVTPVHEQVPTRVILGIGCNRRRTAGAFGFLSAPRRRDRNTTCRERNRACRHDRGLCGSPRAPDRRDGADDGAGNRRCGFGAEERRGIARRARRKAPAGQERRKSPAAGRNRPGLSCQPVNVPAYRATDFA